VSGSVLRCALKVEDDLKEVRISLLELQKKGGRRTILNRSPSQACCQEESHPKRLARTLALPHQLLSQLFRSATRRLVKLARLGPQLLLSSAVPGSAGTFPQP
jgi:hypothetical protein